jgi:hypothetical protein
MHYSPDSWNYRIRRWLYDHSSLGRFVSDRVQFGIKDPEAIDDKQIVHVTDDGLDLYLDPGELPAPDESPDTDQIALFRTALLESQATANAHGIHLVVFIVPTKELVYQERFQDAALRIATDWRYTALLQLLAETGIDHVDLLPPLRAASRGEQLYFAHDTHWTPRGHNVAARILVEHVRNP